MTAAAGQYDVVNELLHSGANVNATNEKGQTSLHYAASKGNVPVSCCSLEIPGKNSSNVRLVDCSSPKAPM